MDKSTLDSLITFGEVIALIAGADVAIHKFFKYLELRATEKTLEPQKLKEFIEVTQRIEERIVDLERNDKQQDQDINGLKSDWHEMVRQITENFLGRKR